MVRGQLSTEEQMKEKNGGHVQPHGARHMPFVQDDSEVFLFSSAHWLLLSLSAVGEGRAIGTWLSRLYENEVVNVISGGSLLRKNTESTPI